jgi:drug/metabolite transporter (DMT)-like permease
MSYPKGVALNTSVVLLLLVTLCWGTTFPLLKSVATDLNGIEISAFRFLLAALCVLPFLIRAPRRAWADGAILGSIALASYVAQAYGLQHISSNRSAFITSLNVLMVPFLGLMFGGRLSWLVLLAACIAVAGIGLMSWESGGSLAGDGATVMCAFAYAAYVVALSRCSAKHEARYLAATQIAVMAAAAIAWILFQSARGAGLATLAARAQPHFMTLLYLGVVATAGMLFLQALAQRNVSADKAAVIYTMEPVFAAVFGWLWLNEMLGLRGLAGATLVVAALIMSEIRAASFGKST